MTYEIKYRREDEMRNSGIEWLGMIPKDFVLKSLKFSYKFSTGSTPSSGDDSYYSEDGYRWVNISDIKDKYIRDTTNYISDKAIKNINIKLNKKGSLVYSFKLSVGQVAFLEDDMYTNEAIATFDISNKNRLDFLYYMAPIFIIRNANENIYGAKLLNQNLINNAKILIPNLDTQQKIANFLDLKTSEFDSIISKRELLIEKLEEAKKSLISEVVTGKVKIVDGELVEREPDEMKDSGVQWLGMIPKEWEVSKIKYISKLNNRTLSNNVKKELEMLYIDIGSVDNTGNINEVQELIFKDAPSRARRIVSYEDSIVSTVRTYLKAIAYIDSRYDGFICSTGFAVFTPAKTKINPKYFYYIINSEEYINQIVSRSTGVSYPAINAGEITNLTFLLPKLLEQDIMVKILEHKLNGINSVITKTKLQIEKLKQAKQSLISEAVTGKIDLRDWEIQEI